MTDFVPPFTSPFTPSNTASDVVEGLDLSSKTAVITGGTLGIGYETAKALASKGARVIITSRNEAIGTQSALRLVEETGNEKIEFLKIDLSSFASIRAFASEINNRELAVDILVNNAGIFFVPYGHTEDGFERHFGVNHIGHFLLTGLLIPALKRASDSGSKVRVVAVSSVAHFFAQDLEDYNFENNEYDKQVAYGKSKLANILFTVALNKRLQEANMGSSFALHPGVVYTPGVTGNPGALIELGYGDDKGGLNEEAFISAEQGAATVTFAAVHPVLDGLGGLYLEEVGIVGPASDLSSWRGYADYAVDPIRAEALWEKSEELVKETFTF
eukprot:TRINITY_DN11804_c0_g1_i1.p1 TRINITY_DN11804_c0_g1~~TRINITY_DN11804_c0_g1_i1.p1  ORF type:complete len:330 (-),score=72.58 TRINITY_DN11804_c0_g1_i1:40-1029(-)